jgi:type IV pilus assembly protein PilB
VTQGQLDQALEIQRTSGGQLGRILVEMRALSEADLAHALAEQWGLRYIELSEHAVHSEAALLIPEPVARRHGAVAVERKQDKVIVAMYNPPNVVAIDDIRLRVGLEVEVVIAGKDSIERAQQRIYGSAGRTSEVRQQSAERESPRTPHAPASETAPPATNGEKPASILGRLTFGRRPAPPASHPSTPTAAPLPNNTAPVMEIPAEDAPSEAPALDDETPPTAAHPHVAPPVIPSGHDGKKPYVSAAPNVTPPVISRAPDVAKSPAVPPRPAPAVPPRLAPSAPPVPARGTPVADQAPVEAPPAASHAPKSAAPAATSKPAEAAPGVSPWHDGAKPRVSPAPPAPGPMPAAPPAKEREPLPAPNRAKPPLPQKPDLLKKRPVNPLAKPPGASPSRGAPLHGGARLGPSKSDSLPKVDRIGELLLTNGVVTQAQLAQAIEIQRTSGGRLGRVLVDMNAINEAQLARGLAEQWGLPYTDLAEHSIDPAVVRLIPPSIAQRHAVTAVARKHNRITIAMSDPSNVVALDDIRLVTGLDVEIVIASRDDIARAHAQFYGITAEVEEAIKQSTPLETEQVQDADSGEEMALDRLRTMGEEAPIVKVVNQIFTQAIRAGASDIHLEPHRRDVKVRFRIDGLLHDFMAPPKAIQAALVSRVKILASIDIAERRLPQDGHIHLRMESKEFDLRVSTLPTVQGEKVVIRILDQSTSKVSLNKLGMPSALLARWEALVDKPYGMVIVTGPTGSGKTTTLYTSVARINTPERNIVSVEDPVEYQIPRVNQVQVNTRTGLTFANGLRSILRQDPDVVLIGEIRDRETAEIAVQASMTGHLVLSTLHTNDAPGAVTRLRDMGVESFLITSSLIGVLAQRLVRVICPHCKEAYTPPADALRRLELVGEEHQNVHLYRGTGCDSCHKTGYRGRIGVYELMSMTDTLRAMVINGAPVDELRKLAQREGMRTLRQDGVQKVLEGITTFEELLRVVFVNEDTSQVREAS